MIISPNIRRTGKWIACTAPMQRRPKSRPFTTAVIIAAMPFQPNEREREKEKLVPQRAVRYRDLQGK